MQPINALLVALTICIPIVGLVDARGVANHTRISNGMTSMAGAFRSFVSVRPDDRPSCGGVLIDPRIVLTARHCVDIKFKTLTVIPSHYGNSEIEWHRDRARTVKAVCAWTTEEPDLALLFLDKPVVQNHYVAVSRISSAMPQFSERFIQVGLGKINHTHTPDILQYMFVHRTHNGCRPPIRPGTYPYPEKFCYTGETEDQGACPGDSGSPIYRTIGDDREIVGIVASTVNSECTFQTDKGISIATDVTFFRRQIWGLMQECLQTHSTSD